MKLDMRIVNQYNREEVLSNLGFYKDFVAVSREIRSGVLRY